MSDENTPVSEPVPAPVPEPVPVTAPVTPPAPPRSRRPGIWWGVALVLVGLALLVSQFAPGIQLWRFWPLIVIDSGNQANSVLALTLATLGGRAADAPNLVMAGVMASVMLVT